LAKKKPRSKKPAAKRARPAKTGPGPLMRLIRRIPLGVAVRTAIVLLVAGFAFLGLIAADRYVKGLDEFCLKHLKPELPQWCPAELVQRLQELPGDVAGVSVYDPLLPRRVAQRYARDPWVRTVNSVRIEFPDTFAVSLDLRRPEYAVETAGSYKLVDREGFLLPAKYARWSQTVNPLLFIWGVRSRPPTAPGRRWSDPALVGGIETLQAITRRSAITERLVITGADVGNFDGIIDRRSSEIDIIAAGECKIAWGRAPSTKKFGEVPVADKLNYIEEFLKKYPHTDGLEIPVRFAGAGDGILITHSRAAHR